MFVENDFPGDNLIKDFSSQISHLSIRSNGEGYRCMIADLISDRCLYFHQLITAVWKKMISGYIHAVFIRCKVCITISIHIHRLIYIICSAVYHYRMHGSVIQCEYCLQLCLSLWPDRFFILFLYRKATTDNLIFQTVSQNDRLLILLNLKFHCF